MIWRALDGSDYRTKKPRNSLSCCKDKDYGLGCFDDWMRERTGLIFGNETFYSGLMLLCYFFLTPKISIKYKRHIFHIICFTSNQSRKNK